MKKFWFGVIFVAVFVYMGMTSHNTVNKDDFKGKWPFSVEEVILSCYMQDDVKLPIVTIKGDRYGLTAYANNLHGSFDDINAINKFWIDDIKNKGLKVSLGDITNAALKLCD
ncbi:DUF2511 domain-containing protein [Poseidonibacter lekithochrous]|uniref:DUF2511 domain-containing protein n=1 Tax=Poseidonibacter lekithochrous TaxID=1904463 RepID=UPI000D365113|nr:DUF2511 domain-containing protein [Poseidonibacter lekithochrous]